MNYKKTKYTCYYTYLAMSSVFSLPPLLFLTFRQMYGISYTLLGTLVLVNFCTQLLVDLAFTFFSRLFPPHLAVKIMPLLTAVGLTVYALSPVLMPQFVYGGLLLGTVIFSVAAGLCEVLLSPLVAALPSDDAEKDMSTLHSLYAYGVLLVVAVSTIFLKVFGSHNWMYLTLFWALLPIASCVLFCCSPLPEMALEQNGGTKSRLPVGMILCTLCILLGSAAENAMTNWVSGYLENGLSVSKATADILGLALFAVLLGLGRSCYAKWGKNIGRVLLFGMMGAVVCYLAAALAPGKIVPLIACAVTGLCTSMLWPGTLIYMEENLPGVGVAAYALMAAGGDLGASVAPQLLGIVVDRVSTAGWANSFSRILGITSEQLGMKTGMLTAAVFPLLGVLVVVLMRRYFAGKSYPLCVTEDILP